MQNEGYWNQIFVDIEMLLQLDANLENIKECYFLFQPLE